MLGLQLYTVRQKITDASSALATLKAVKKLGYECVQLAGSLETVELTANAAKEAEISVLGILVDMNMCENHGERLFEIARFCGAKDLGISSSIQTDAEAYDLISRANAFAKIANENGLTFSYHNHSNEFIRGKSGKLLIELLKEGFDSSLVSFMPDTYWIQHGGADVRAFLETLKGRTKILHLKDMKRAPDGPTFAEIGVGNINFEGIIKVAKNIGIEYFIVEQDKCDGDPIDSARISCEYLRKIL